ncbi:hypothetical protein DFH06DRAFT_1143133 [Mycena polygramma]|nr:hypothetical protein DFH06DRAFT_1143133 [Mycena polygramma]
MFTKNEKPGGGPSKAPKVWWSLGRCRPEGVTEVRRIRTKVARWNSSEEQSRMVKQSSEVMQQICSNHIPTEIFGDIRICGGFKAVTQPTSCSNTPEVFGTKAEPRPRVPRGICREGEGSGNGKHWRCRPKAGGQPKKAEELGRRSDTSPDDPDKSRKVEQFGNKDRRHPRDVRNRKDRDRGSEGNFAKSCEENRRRAPKIAGGANRGLEGSTERDSRLKRSLGDARPKGDRNPEEPEEGREVLINSRERPNEIPDSNGASESNGQMVTQVRKNRKGVGGANRYGREGSGEDIWDFGKDVRDPERPESFSGASLGNRKSQNTIRTSVRVRASGDDSVGTTPERLEAEPEWNFRTDNPAKAN